MKVKACTRNHCGIGKGSSLCASFGLEYDDDAVKGLLREQNPKVVDSILMQYFKKAKGSREADDVQEQEGEAPHKISRDAGASDVRSGALPTEMEIDKILARAQDAGGKTVGAATETG